MGLIPRTMRFLSRAPVVTSCGAGVEIISKIEKGIVAVRKDRHYALAFHPELR